MDLNSFTNCFEKKFPLERRESPGYDFPFARRLRKLADPCPDISGMASLKKLRLLSAAVSFLPTDRSECYLEVGTYHGKSFIAALKENASRFGVACDDFSEFSASPEESCRKLRSNLSRYGLLERVKFYNECFASLFGRWESEQLPSVGVYFYDGAHDEMSQYEAIKTAERILSDEALVLVDDWRHADDSGSYAEAGTKRAISESKHQWDIRWQLPARHNGDVDMWWNGIGVLTFRRRAS